MLALVSCLVLAAAQPQSSALSLSRLPDEAQLARLLWEHSPELTEARAHVGEARAESTRARLIPNPSLNANWGTIPVGATNPPGLAHPLSNIPNYTLGLSETFELGKRGPRQRAASKALEAADLTASDALRVKLLELYDAVGRAAAANLRAVSLDDLASDAAKLSELQRQRARHGDTAGLDADRSRLEEETFRSALLEERQKEREALLDCSRLSGMRCEPFATSADAQAFLASAASGPGEPTDAPERRPDLRALEAQEQSARAAAELARAKAIPDPNLNAAFTYDTFTAAGNQQRSVSLGVSVPLPIFDHGQAELQQAAAAETAARVGRAQRLEQARTEVEELTARAATLVQRRSELQGSTIPLARGVVDRLASAVASGGAPLQDLLLARRTLGELLQSAADLDLEILENALALRRAAGAGPSLPDAAASQL